MSWEHFYRLAKEVANKIKSSGYVPDMIIGLARGGWCLARVLCDFIGVKDLVSLKVEHWGITATPDGKAKLKYPFNIDLTGKKVLVVDDITDTGESMRISVDYVKTLNPSEVRTAALRHIEGSKFKPDYYAEKITWRWVIFPWNFVEDLCNLVEKVQSEVDKPSDTKLLKAKLKEYFKVDVDEETVREILAEVDRRKKLKPARP
ncbi:xanthine phosphoribosyltransferase [Candidatus Bathyarchaeota archaeon B24-2]|nr:MAG: xanthine phosphoribosyltransferase [Candidatus Bathyarchaeota archaeon B24-2]